MSNLTASVLAAVRGRNRASRLENEPAEDLEDETTGTETGAEGDEEEVPAAETDEDDTEAEGDERPEDTEEDEPTPANSPSAPATMPTVSKRRSGAAHWCRDCRGRGLSDPDGRLRA